MTPEYVIDGSRITSLETFYDEITRVVIPDYPWGRNLDAFNDMSVRSRRKRPCTAFNA
ncbi:MAG: barstar family protein [Hyphomonadaceae bacterium]|mgnify:CR=1 FL=1|nr:barstar family protein [Hyphomonadaceae bacterium]